MKWYRKEIRRAVKKATQKGLCDGIEFLKDESNKIAPHDEGTLIQDSRTSIDGEKATLSYGNGPSAPYVKRLHEHPEYNFQKGRQGKWVEKTLNDHKGTALKHIEKEIKKALKGG